MIAEYLIEHHPNAKHLSRVRVGPLPDVAALLPKEGISPKLYYPLLHWADALAVYPDHTVILECKIKLTADALGQILINAGLFYETHELKPLHDKPLVMEVVYAYGDPFVLKQLHRHDVRTTQFRPKWTEEYYLAKLRAI